MLVQPTLNSRLSRKEERPKSSKTPRLWASEIGGCLRKAMLRIKGYAPTQEFSVKSLVSMHLGNVYETDTGHALAEEYGADLTPQVWLGDDKWSCYADFVLWHKTDRAVIIEHKALADKWWNYRDNIPDPKHVIQLALYGYLYKSMFGIEPALVLFYRSWGHYAELNLEVFKDYVAVTGTMDDAQFSRVNVAVNMEKIRAEAEAAYAAGEIPPAFPAPKDGACLFRGEASCPMYGHCWGGK